MTTTSNWQFGLIVAYVLPGFIGLAGIAPIVPGIAAWLSPSPQGIGIGPPAYALLAAAGIGMILGCFRWLSLDQIHLHTGIVRPEWNESELAANLGAFDYLVQNHFRYYEFCGNTLMALVFAYGLNRFSGRFPFLNIATDVGMVVIVAVLFAASRDALAKYYSRTARLVGATVADRTGDMMYNGNDHGAVGVPSQHSESKEKKKTLPEEKPRPAEEKISEPKKS
jgi:hypothetical protein